MNYLTSALTLKLRTSKSIISTSIISTSIISTSIMPFVLLSSLLLVTACGGGGGGSDGGSDGGSTAVTTPQSSAVIQPEADNTSEQDATPTSLDLQVKESFTFDHHQQVNLDISAQDPNGNALPEKEVSVYQVPDDIEAWDDEMQDEASLLFKARTDELGELQRQIELPNNVSQVLLVLSYIGLENKVLVRLENGQVNHLFQ